MAAERKAARKPSVIKMLMKSHEGDEDKKARKGHKGDEGKKANGALKYERQNAQFFNEGHEDDAEGDSHEGMKKKAAMKATVIQKKAMKAVKAMTA